ncbi:MAG TPA: PIN domain-containing protein [Rhizomicrobium sp.]
MAEKVTLDTNILIYTVDPRDPLRQTMALEIVKHAAATKAALTTISLGEFFWAASRKFKLDKTYLRQQLHDFAVLFDTTGYDTTDLFRGAQESEAGRFEFWDAVMLSAADRAGCTVCLSEDMHDGAKLGGITVRNPFGARGISDAARPALGL